jgi:hypothetical protein
METINNYINCTDLNDIRKNYLLTEETKVKDNFFNPKIKSLISHKFSIETLLNLIKQFQFDSISGKSQVNGNKKTKEMLLEFKEKLSNNLKKKTKIFKINKRELEDKKEKINKKNLINKYITEIEQLRFINFNIENQIKSVDFMIKEKSEINEKKFEYFGSLYNQKIFGENHKEIKSTALEIMKDDRQELQQKLIESTIQKSEKEEEINKIRLTISNLKNKIKEKKLPKFESKEGSDSENCMNKIQSDENQSVREKYKDLIKKWEDYFINKNISGSESSNKETNFCSVKNYVDNIDKLDGQDNINYHYLKNQIFFDIDNDKSLNSFNSSLDSDNDF